MRILGIDPGSSRIGYGLIEGGRNLKIIDSGLIEIKSKTVPEKLYNLGEQFKNIIQKTKPDKVALEKIFFFKNQKTIIEVAEARGVIILITLQNNIPLVEFSPVEVKHTITNYGRADKKGVIKMVCKILNLESIKGPDDIADALAIAITAAHHNNRTYNL